MVQIKEKKVFRIVLVSIVAFIAVLIGGFYIYTLDYYRADAAAVPAMGTTSTGVKIESESGLTIFYPKPDNDIKTALIFYPGGKVEDVAYAPLLEQLSNEGLTCVLVKMPFNLAVFNIGAADSVYKLLPDIKNWYIGGHSLGGAMASSYVGKNSEKLSGLILLGAYPVNASNLPILVVYGSEDIKLDLSKIEGVKNVVQIAGGNHAQFGNYGVQKGDGNASISREYQQAQTVKAIVTFIKDTNE